MKRIAPPFGVLALSLVFSGCLAHMSGASQDKFDACWPRLERRECGGAVDAEAFEACRGALNDEYLALEQQSQRDRWLVRKGCPESRVYPELE